MLKQAWVARKLGLDKNSEDLLEAAKAVKGKFEGEELKPLPVWFVQAIQIASLGQNMYVIILKCTVSFELILSAKRDKVKVLWKEFDEAFPPVYAKWFLGARYGFCSAVEGLEFEKSNTSGTFTNDLEMYYYAINEIIAKSDPSQLVQSLTTLGVRVNLEAHYIDDSFVLRER